MLLHCCVLVPHIVLILLHFHYLSVLVYYTCYILYYRIYIFVSVAIVLHPIHNILYLLYTFFSGISFEISIFFSFTNFHDIFKLMKIEIVIKISMDLST